MHTRDDATLIVPQFITFDRQATIEEPAHIIIDYFSRLKQEDSRMDNFDMLESKSIYIIREAYYRFKNIAVLWSVGKDSTTLLWLIRKAFFGKIPFPIVHIDTSYKFPEMYEFRDRLSRDWGFHLIVGRNDEQLANGMGPSTGMKLDCCTELKTNALNKLLINTSLRPSFSASGGTNTE